MIERDIAGSDSWILSGSICGWGDPLLQHFTIAVFLYLDPSVRMARLTEREAMRYGKRIQVGGDMCQHHLAFMAWAESYDSESTPIRSLDLHEQWMKRLSCPILRLDSSKPVTALVRGITNQMILA